VFLISAKAYAYQSMSTFRPKIDEPKFGASHLGILRPAPRLE